MWATSVNTFCLAIIVVPILAFVLIYGALMVLERKGILYPSNGSVEQTNTESNETKT